MNKNHKIESLFPVSNSIQLRIKFKNYSSATKFLNEAMQPFDTYCRQLVTDGEVYTSVYSYFDDLRQKDKIPVIVRNTYCKITINKKHKNY